MNRIYQYLTVFVLLQLTTQASQTSLATAIIPVESPSDSPVRVTSVPFYTSGPYPEALISAITEPYFIKQGEDETSYDINLASVAKLLIHGTYLHKNNADKSEVHYLVWDFSKADPKLINKDLIDGVIKCIKKTLGKKNAIHSKFVGFDKFLESKNQITKSFPLIK